MGNPRSGAAGDLNSRINELLSGNQSQYETQPMSLAQMNDVVRNQLIGDRNRSLSQAGGLASARGYSMGLSNPFSLAQRAEAGVYNSYAPALQNVLGSNLDRSFNQQFQSRNANFSRLAQLLGLQAGNLQNMSTGAWNETIGPLLGSAIGAGGSIYGGYLGGKH